VSAPGLVIDLFAGGGGASTGIEAALGRPVDLAINHDKIALAAHTANHPRTRHLEASVWDVKPLEAVVRANAPAAVKVAA
jgi:DNA (cytosine-5)-methyltransferase 1